MSKAHTDTYEISRDEFLYPYVKLIVFHSHENADMERRYIFFPNVGASLTFYSDTDFYAESYNQFISREKKGCCGVVLQINRIDPVEIIDIGKQKRVTIIFKPLGINHFIPSSLKEIQKDQNPSAIKSVFVQGNQEVFACLTNPGLNEKKCDALRSFLRKNYHGFENAMLKEIVHLLLNNEKNDGLSVIGRQVGASTKTINRLFNEHIRLSAVEFKRVCQFRNSVALRLSDNSSSFHKVAFESNYYDLPYMMKAYRTFTRQSAKQFFDALHISANGLYLYQEYL